MAYPTSIVLSTINAPYCAQLDAATLAQALSSPATADVYLGPVYAFFTELPVETQTAFVEACHLDVRDVQAVATHVANEFGHDIPLAA